MIQSNNVSAILTSHLELYSNLRIVFFVMFVVFLAISIFYAVRFKALTILSKRTGLNKKREIALMKAGKGIKRRNPTKRPSEDYTLPISYVNENLNQVETEKLSSTTAIDTMQVQDTTMLDRAAQMQDTTTLDRVAQMQATTVLNQQIQEEHKKEFKIIKNIIVVHGEKPLI